ncbi:glycosyltransferase family 2 protein [Aureibaculum sp. A20]|uniref:Glycosyltransferase family 2 protein n=1 Tax=Aureibaculum flavum TaxID=2795986 RepID=A0ABS0WRJ8_9FLAO|nr:glycosyltransferase family 2 protein [Aureibaculum flavum]MBJ2174577.1 glycosyltransferase family 2 protein [Aureibaculum flavum]
MEFSVVIPLYKCSQSLLELTKRLNNALTKITNDFEIIYVNDDSPENDWDVMYDLGQRHSFVKGINLSRNFGQHYAITAGLSYAKGDWIIVMDGDLQDQPEEIIKLYNKTKEGYDIVFAQRKVRKDSFLKKMSSTVFYKLFSYLTDTKQDATIGNFGIYHRKVIDAVLRMKDNIRYFPTMTQWVGFNKTAVEVDHAIREEGKSAYSFKSLLALAFNNMIAFSEKPLRLVVKFGFLMSFVTTLMAVFYLFKYFSKSITEIGYTSIILSIWFLSGVIITILGIVGIYVGKTFEKVKERPLFIVKDQINL